MDVDLNHRLEQFWLLFKISDLFDPNLVMFVTYAYVLSI